MKSLKTLTYNAVRGMIEQVFIPQTTGDWGNGDIHIGFNMSRTFNLKKKDKTTHNEW